MRLTPRNVTRMPGIKNMLVATSVLRPGTRGHVAIVAERGRTGRGLVLSVLLKASPICASAERTTLGA